MYDRAAALSADQRSKAAIGKCTHCSPSSVLQRRSPKSIVLATWSTSTWSNGSRYVVSVSMADAEREFGRVVAASGSRSDLRIGR